MSKYVNFTRLKSLIELYSPGCIFAKQGQVARSPPCAPSGTDAWARCPRLAKTQSGLTAFNLRIFFHNMVVHACMHACAVNGHFGLLFQS